MLILEEDYFKAIILSFYVKENVYDGVPNLYVYYDLKIDIESESYILNYKAPLNSYGVKLKETFRNLGINLYHNPNWNDAILELLVGMTVDAEVVVKTTVKGVQYNEVIELHPHQEEDVDNEQ